MLWLLSTEFKMLRDPITWLFAKVELSDFGSHIYSLSNGCLYLFSLSLSLSLSLSHTHTHTHTHTHSLESFCSFHKNDRSDISANVVHMDRCSMLSYIKMLSYAKDLIPNICRQHLNYSELHKYQISMHTLFLAKANIL